MKAYECGISKDDFIKEIKQHQALDHFIQGSYSRGEKGCAVGCSIKSIKKLKNINLVCGDHSNYEKHLGIPEWLACLEDSIFENIPLEEAKKWPLKFSEAINTGADLNQIKKPFIIYILKNNIKLQKSQLLKFPEAKEVIEEVIKISEVILKLYQTNEEVDSAAWSAAWSVARSVWSAAESAATSAVAWSAARSVAWSAARSAAWSAESAVRSVVESGARSAKSASWSAQAAAESEARSAQSAVAWSVARSAGSAAAWSAARSVESAELAESARLTAYKKQANYLLKLIKRCK